MWPILRIELFKIFSRPRTYISFVAITVIVALIQLALYVDGKNYIQFGMQSLTQGFDIEGNVLNGYLVCFIILQTLLIHVPLLIALVAGDAIAGEANMGTLRILLTRPVGRVELLLAKFAASLVYTLLLLVWMALLALFLSLFIFGKGDLMILKSEEVVVLAQNDVFWRYGWAFLFASLSMVMVAALAFLLSIFADNSIGPIITTMSIVILFTILTTLDIPFFQLLRPWLFTTHMLGWKAFFDDPIPWQAVSQSAAILLLHILFFAILGAWVFKRKDILS
ncbi:MAG TPA: ABC transporter permease subunit [Flavihumibacter sp.]|nr:ABC transporter permease [Bacteroidota bacterium]HOA38712.1 ABC transporter permease subunit [Flavihumibacter sp.]HQD10257.1 ABC transporter permease subunit [Flavihumibacter sp.]